MRAGNGSKRKGVRTPKRNTRNEASPAQVAARERFLRQNPPSPEALEAAGRELRDVLGE